MLVNEFLTVSKRSRQIKNSLLTRIRSRQRTLAVRGPADRNRSLLNAFLPPGNPSLTSTIARLELSKSLRQLQHVNVLEGGERKRSSTTFRTHQKLFLISGSTMSSDDSHHHHGHSMDAMGSTKMPAMPVRALQTVGDSESGTYC